jgi:hypothetical protein
MTSAEILAAIAADATLTALAAARNDAAIATALSVGRTTVQSKIVTARGIAALYPGGALAAETVLMKLEAARDSMLASTTTSTVVMGSLLRRQLAFLASNGLDFGDATLRGMLDYFASVGVITTTEAGNLKGMALTADPVPVSAVSLALNGG